MPNYPATPYNDRWTVPRYGDPSNTLIDGLGGFDSLDFDRLLLSRFSITLDDTSGFIQIDSVSGASSIFHLKLKNVEMLTFNGGRDVVNLITLFADTTAPEITGFSPTDGATDVATDSNIIVSFNEPLSMANGAISLLDHSGLTVENFSATSLRISGTQLIIDPALELSYGQRYTLSIAPGAVMDSSGNSYQGYAGYEFTTRDNTAPVALPAQFVLQEDSIIDATLPPGSDAEFQTLSYALADIPSHGGIVFNTDGSFSYTPTSEYSGSDSFSYTVFDGEMISSATTVTLSITPVLDRIMGTSTADILTGNLDGDILQGGAGDDILDGRGGLDFGIFNGVRNNYEILNTNGELIITDTLGSDGTDILSNIERLIFSDQGIAFDLNGNAGSAAELLGLLLGAGGVYNKEYMGIALDLLDNGMSYEQLMTLAFNELLGPDPAHRAVVELAYSNIADASTNIEAIAQFTSQLDDGDYTIGEFGVMAAQSELNHTNIGLTGLAETGIAYLLVV